MAPDRGGKLPTYGAAEGKPNAMLEYTFDCNRKPTKVKMPMKKAIATDTDRVFVKRL